ncbi:hypothetical protein [Georgenia muralis]
MLLTSGRLRTLRRLTYRCATTDRCLLLEAVDVTPLGVLLHQRRYKYSPAENERRSSEAGRARNTYDGANHWRERSYFIETSALAYPEDRDMHLGVSCDHVLDYMLTGAEFVRDWEAGHAEVRVQSDGSRYAIG